jgi:hypothetical protein
MALYYWALNRGQNLQQVQASATPLTGDFLVTVDLTTNTPTRTDVANALKMITTFLLSHNYPPA